MAQALLIVWRESVEALLVIGLLYAWLQRLPVRHRPQGERALWLGALAGAGLALLLASLMLLAGNWLSGPAGEWFQVAMAALASALVLQMVIWMAGNNATPQRRSAPSHPAAVALLAGLAVAREGSEIALFLYGAAASSGSTGLLTGALTGLLCGVLSFVILQRGSRLLNWRRFFQLSTLLLTLLGGAMLMSAVDRASTLLMGLELPAAAYDWLGNAMWDSSALLDDSTRAGALFASLTGYRAHPALPGLLLLTSYWLLAWWGCHARRVRYAGQLSV
ncbi:FTR1 family protein [Halopseudomonas maritima]|uniref:FTR1 family protein n=1 Tax=Halopseudomonas maritima TaxID=2918528 RepID=UPI001EEB9F80|nr:FTR1 family protein [Halopseudomonas maritima]UJJ32730.1 FTR1 family protein [Halopseudomonas maritima]